MPPWCESILGWKVEAVQGKQVSLEWTETSGGLWECGTILEFLSPFLWRAPPLRCDGNAGNSFPTTLGKDPPPRARRRKRAILDVGGTLVLPLEWSGYVGELLELQHVLSTYDDDLRDPLW